MKDLKVNLVQTGHNLDRLYEDKKIDREAYEILTERNNQALSIFNVSKVERSETELLIGLLNHLQKKYMIAMITTKNEDLVADYLANL